MSKNRTRVKTCALLFLNTKQAVANDATTTTTTTSARARMLLLTECSARIVDPTVLDDLRHFENSVESYSS
jgi:hypothetical protein